MQIFNISTSLLKFTSLAKMAVFTVLQMLAKILQKPQFAVVFATACPGYQKSAFAYSLLVFSLRAKTINF